MNKKQRENTIKLLYDIVRYSIIGIIFINLAPGKELSWWSIIAGGIIGFLAYSIAIWLDRKED
jgi:hypothetical protein